ncbi:MAG: hypothetical protein WC897_00385 [Candidatus Gracilibacteria bacterium]
MQRFTLFSLILSVAVILIISDTVFHDYLNRNGDLPAPDSTGEDVSEVVEMPTASEPTETLLESNLDTVETNDAVELQSEIEPLTDTGLFLLSGFATPVLKETTFSGLVFQFIPFSSSGEDTVFQWNLFDGENYVGSVYEIKYSTDTSAFQGYLTLRDSASSITELGEMNEVNNYGDASFYFNHKTKIKTVHVVMRSGKDIFAFEYAQSFHENMKKVFDIL